MYLLGSIYILSGRDGSLGQRHWPCTLTPFHPISFPWEIQKIRGVLGPGLESIWFVIFDDFDCFLLEKLTSWLKKTKKEDWKILNWHIGMFMPLSERQLHSVKLNCGCWVDKAETDGLGFLWNIWMKRRKWLGPLSFQWCQIHTSKGLWMFDPSSRVGQKPTLACDLQCLWHECCLEHPVYQASLPCTVIYSISAC